MCSRYGDIMCMLVARAMAIGREIEREGERRFELDECAHMKLPRARFIQPQSPHTNAHKCTIYRGDRDRRNGNHYAERFILLSILSSSRTIRYFFSLLAPVRECACPSVWVSFVDSFMHFVYGTAMARRTRLFSLSCRCDRAHHVAH